MHVVSLMHAMCSAKPYIVLEGSTGNFEVEPRAGEDWVVAWGCSMAEPATYDGDSTRESSVKRVYNRRPADERRLWGCLWAR